MADQNDSKAVVPTHYAALLTIMAGDPELCMKHQPFVQAALRAAEDADKYLAINGAKATINSLDQTLTELQTYFQGLAASVETVRTFVREKCAREEAAEAQTARTAEPEGEQEVAPTPEPTVH